MNNPQTTTQNVAGGQAAPAKTLHWSTVSDTYDNITKPHSGTVADLYATLEAWQRRSSQSSAKGGVAIIGARFTQGPHTGKNAADYPGEQRWRLLTRVQDCTLLMLDIDGATCSVEAARSPWAEVCRIDWSTHSHGVPSKPGLRMRLLMPYARHVSDQEHRVIYAWAVDRMTAAGVDKMDLGTKDPTRLMYGPGSVSRESLREPWLCFADGPFLDPDNLPGGGSVGELLAAIDAAKEAKEAAREAERVEREREAQRRIAERGVRDAFEKAEDESGSICPTVQLYLPDLDPKRVLAWAERVAQKLVQDIATSTAGDRHYTARDAALFFGNVLAGLDELGACLTAEAKERVSWSSEVSGIEGRVRDMEAEAVSVGDNDPTRARAVQWGVDQGRGQPHLPDYRLKSQFRPSRMAKDKKVVSLPPPVPATATPTPIEDSGKGEGGGGATITQIQHQDPQARVFAALESVVAVVEAEGDDSILTLTTWADALGVVAEVWPSLPAGGKTPPSVLLAALGPQPVDRIEVWSRRAELAVATIDRRHTKAGWRNDDDKAADFLRAACGKDARVEAEIAAFDEPWRVALAWTARGGDEAGERARVLAKVLENFGKFVKPEAVKPAVKAALPAPLWSMVPAPFGPKAPSTKTAEEKKEARDSGSVRGCMPDAPIAEGAVVPKGWKIRGGAVGKMVETEDGSIFQEVIKRAILIVANQEDAEGEQWVTLAFMSGGRWRTRSVQRLAICDRNKLLATLPPYGAKVNSSNASDCVDWLAAFEEENDHILPRCKVSQSMGWQGEAGARGFLLGETWIGSDGEAIEARADDPNTWSEGAWALASNSRAVVRDARKFSAAREGTMEGWTEAVRSILHYPRIHFALYASLAAPLVGILGTRTPIVDWSGPPGTGKTSAMRLAASVWGAPAEMGHGVMGSWSGTITAHERRAGLLNSLPIMLNDSNKADPWVPTKVIYELAEGTGKERGSGSEDRQVVARWATVALSTGERKLIDMVSAKDAGAAHRVVCLHGSPWGGIIDQSIIDDFRDSLDEHHGHAGRAWITWLTQWLAEPGRDREAKAMHRTLKQTLTKLVGKNNVANRFAEDFATFALAAALASKCFGWSWLKLATDQMEQIFGEIVKGAVNLTAHERAVQIMWDYAIGNSVKFYGRKIDYRSGPDGESIQEISSVPPPTADGWAGAWHNTSDWKEIAFRDETLRAVLAKHDISATSVIEDWLKAGWMRRDGKNKRPKVRIADISPKPRLVCLTRDAIERVCGLKDDKDGEGEGEK